MSENRPHVPVMLNEVITGLNIKANGFYLDGTFGFGGHSEIILQKLTEGGCLLGIDRDPQAIAQGKDFFLTEVKEKKVMFAQSRFDQFDTIAKKHGIAAFDGILLDLGVSSYQLDQGERGFSWRQNASLDMRMNPDSGPSAAELINSLNETELADIFFHYGEEPKARHYAKVIIKARAQEFIQTTEQLAELIAKNSPYKGRSRRHPATKIFQALRIAVNNELEALNSFLEKAPNYLNTGGRFVVLSYHSLEDRPVKHNFRQQKQVGNYKLITKKPLIPSVEEIAKNPRARSAKLRIAERTEQPYQEQASHSELGETL